MKQSCLLFLLTVCTITSSYSQLKYGVRAGVNSTNYAINGDMPFDPRISMYGGVMGVMPVRKSISFESGLFLSGKGSKTPKSVSYESVKQLTYLSVPIMISYSPIKNFAIAAGPQMSVLLSEKFKGMTFQKETKSYEVGAIVDLSYQIKTIGISFRYDHGLTQVFKVVLNQQEPLQYGYRFRSRTFQFGAFYLFPSKKFSGR